jgi:RNA polymerase sigma factor (TIGR02999 family)
MDEVQTDPSPIATTHAPPSSAPAAAQLLPLVYDQLKQLARQRMSRERAGHSMQPTDLVHEAYLRIVANTDVPWSGRTQFFCAAATAMRRILIDHARRRTQLKRGGGRHQLPATALELASDQQLPQILALDEALSRLEQVSPDVAAVVRLRFFGGMSIDETAAALGISARTVKRDWTYARARLFRELSENAWP